MSKVLEERLIEMSKIADKQQEEIERLENIINEVREYIENNVIYTTSGMCLASDTTFGEDILEILDKEKE